MFTNRFLPPPLVASAPVALGFVGLAQLRHGAYVCARLAVTLNFNPSTIPGSVVGYNLSPSLCASRIIAFTQIEEIEPPSPARLVSRPLQWLSPPGVWLLSARPRVWFPAAALAF